MGLPDSLVEAIRETEERREKDDAVVLAALDWAEWRQGQCDYPDGLSDQEVKLLKALGYGA